MTLTIFKHLTFQWYKEVLNATIFDLSNHFYGNSKIHWDSNSQIGSPLGSVWVHSFTFSLIFWNVNVIISSHLSMPLLGSWRYTHVFIFIFLNLSSFDFFLRHQYYGDFYFTWISFLSHLQKFNDDEWVDMPTCNLAKIVHNIWLEQSGKHGTCLFITTFNNYV
jgi:hypothetical protein